MPRETLHMKQANKKGDRNKTGAYGEQIAVTHLQNKGFSVLDTNYLKKWGEIDIVARETSDKKALVHFIEVKTVSYETKAALNRSVSHGTWRPEEQVTRHKLHKLHKAIESWLLENNYSGDWQIDIMAIRIVPRETFATVTYMPNIII